MKTYILLLIFFPVLCSEVGVFEMDDDKVIQGSIHERQATEYIITQRLVVMHRRLLLMEPYRGPLESDQLKKEVKRLEKEYKALKSIIHTFKDE